MYEEIHVGPSPKFLSKPKSLLQIKETIPIDIIIRLLQVQLTNDPLDLLQTFKSKTSFAIKSESIINLPQKNFVNLIVDYLLNMLASTLANILYKVPVRWVKNL